MFGIERYTRNKEKKELVKEEYPHYIFQCKIKHNFCLGK